MTLYDNERADNPTPIPITIHTRVPSKWRFVDMETGDIWMPHEGQYLARAIDVVVTTTPTALERAKYFQLLREWYAWWKDTPDLPAKLPNSLHVRTALEIGTPLGDE